MITHLAWFCGGIVAFIIFAAIRLKLMKRRIFQKPAICIHCKALIEVEDTNHWERCPKHPARQMIMDLMNERDDLIKMIKGGLRSE